MLACRPQDACRLLIDGTADGAQGILRQCCRPQCIHGESGFRSPSGGESGRSESRNAVWALEPFFRDPCLTFPRDRRGSCHSRQTPIRDSHTPGGKEADGLGAVVRRGRRAAPLSSLGSRNWVEMGNCWRAYAEQGKPCRSRTVLLPRRPSSMDCRRNAKPGGFPERWRSYRRSVR